MTEFPPTTIVNVGYRSTNYWVVSAGTSRLLIDLGYPGTFGKMRADLKRAGIPLGEIRHALATHFHLDHADLAQEFKQAGIRLIVLEPQLAAIPLMKQFMKPSDRYTEITLHDNLVLPFHRSRALLAEIGGVRGAAGRPRRDRLRRRDSPHPGPLR